MAEYITKTQSRKAELEKQIKAIDSLRAKVKRLSMGEKVSYTTDEYDVLLDLRNIISKLPDDTIE